VLAPTTSVVSTITEVIVTSVWDKRNGEKMNNPITTLKMGFTIPIIAFHAPDDL
jgi:hypothetical protein